MKSWRFTRQKSLPCWYHGIEAIEPIEATETGDVIGHLPSGYD